MKKYIYLSLFLMTAVLTILPTDNINHTEKLITQEIEEAKKSEEKDCAISYWHKTKRLVKAPVDYVFGQESSRAKTAFYTVMSVIIAVVIMYGIYRYGLSVGLASFAMKEAEQGKSILENLRKKWADNPDVLKKIEDFCQQERELMVAIAKYNAAYKEKGIQSTVLDPCLELLLRKNKKVARENNKRGAELFHDGVISARELKAIKWYIFQEACNFLRNIPEAYERVNLQRLNFLLISHHQKSIKEQQESVDLLKQLKKSLQESTDLIKQLIKAHETIKAKDEEIVTMQQKFSGISGALRSLGLDTYLSYIGIEI